MKIKQRKYMNKKEMLNWLTDNSCVQSVNREYDPFNDSNEIVFKFKYKDEVFFMDGEKFGITEEVEIDEETKLNLVVVLAEHLGNTDYVVPIYHTCLRELQENEKIKYAYLQNPDGSIGELIWTKERGLINLINETLIHPHINTKWHVIGFEKGMLECVSEDSVKVEYITKEFGLEMYAEQQKHRADELENNINELKQEIDNKILKQKIINKLNNYNYTTLTLEQLKEILEIIEPINK